MWQQLYDVYYCLSNSYAIVFRHNRRFYYRPQFQHRRKPHPLISRLSTDHGHDIIDRELNLNENYSLVVNQQDAKVIDTIRRLRHSIMLCSEDVTKRKMLWNVNAIWRMLAKLGACKKLLKLVLFLYYKDPPPKNTNIWKYLYYFLSKSRKKVTR